MNGQVTKNKIKELPDAPGVYLFLGTPKRSGGDWRGGKILYVGKATSLKDRVRSYFNQDIVNTRSPLISKMLSQFDDIKFIKTDSVLEALVLEANLIKKYQPEANIKEKDNRSFNYVVITNEDFPRVLIMRGRELEAAKMNYGAVISERNSAKPAKEFILAAEFGPFPNGSQLKEALKIVRKMFPFRDKCIPANFLRCHLRKKSPKGDTLGNPCFNRQIGLCPGVCTGEISQKEYAQNIKNIILFFESKKQVLIKKLEKQMRDFAKARQFEKAQKIKKTIFTLGHIQDVSLIKDQVSKGTFDNNFRIESYDIAHLSGTNMVGAMTVLENGEIKKSDYRKFKIKNNVGADDTRAISEVLLRRLAHIEWPKADLIVVDGGLAQKRAVEKILKLNNMKIPVVSVVKDERHKPKNILGMNYESRVMNYDKKEKNLKQYEREILLANAEAHRFAIGFHKQLRGKFLKK